MKNVSARATFKGNAADKLFGTREAARETARKVLDTHFCPTAQAATTAWTRCG